MCRARKSLFVPDTALELLPMNSFLSGEHGFQSSIVVTVSCSRLTSFDAFLFQTRLVPQTKPRSVVLSGLACESLCDQQHAVDLHAQ